MLFELYMIKLSVHLIFFDLLERIVVLAIPHHSFFKVSEVFKDKHAREWESCFDLKDYHIESVVSQIKVVLRI